MSTTIFTAPGLYATQLVGPTSEGDDRYRVELMVADVGRETVRLTRIESIELAHALIRSATKPRDES